MTMIDRIELDVATAVVAVPRIRAVVVPSSRGTLAKAAVAASAFLAFVRLVGTAVIAVGHHPLHRSRAIPALGIRQIGLRFFVPGIERI
jgi:hypothetical protein